MDICTLINDDGTNHKSDLQELIRVMPTVPEKLSEHSCLDIYSKWCKMMSNDTFPMENIRFCLFLDVIRVVILHRIVLR